jgi:hypothetical protein
MLGDYPSAVAVHSFVGFDRRGTLSYEGAMTGAAVQLIELREDLERLLLLEQVVVRRQEAIERRLDEAQESGITPEQLRSQLNLSKESARQLLELDATLAERIGISQETVENLKPDD